MFAPVIFVDFQYRLFLLEISIIPEKVPCNHYLQKTFARLSIAEKFCSSKQLSSDYCPNLTLYDGQVSGAITS